MPFHGFRRHSFSRVSIQQNAPRSPGVYGTSNAKEWIFVGSSQDIQTALLGHLNSAGTARNLVGLPTQHRKSLILRHAVYTQGPRQCRPGSAIRSCP